MKKQKKIISVHDVFFEYGGNHVLENINLDIRKGEYVGIIGPNGSGKTTLLKIILGLLQPQSGEVFLWNTPLKSFNHWERLGYVSQKATQRENRFPITVTETVQLGAKNKSQIKEALEVVNMWEFKDKLLNKLSGGQQQRVFIAKALASNPSLLVLDEPTVGIDQESQEKFYELISGLNKNAGLTVVLVSHDIDVVVNEVTNLVCINKTLVYHGSPHKFIKDDYLEKLYGKGRQFILHDH